MLLRVREAAGKLDLSASTIYDLIQKGALPCHRVGPKGGAIRISAEDLENYLRQCRREANREQWTPARRVKLKHLRS
jgi:excisionase family DNA binding protein